MEKRRVFGGADVEFDGELIVAVDFNQIAGLRYELGQIVYSNGRLWTPYGNLGIITKLQEPFSAGHTANVIGVWFEGARQVLWMKPKDLLPPGKKP